MNRSRGLKRFVCVAAACLAALAARAAETTWYIRGEFPFKQGAPVFKTDYLAAEGGEDHLTIAQITSQWRQVRLPVGENLSFMKYFKVPEYVVAYAARLFVLTNAQSFFLRAKPDDGMMLWINGERRGPFGIAEYNLPVTLPAGTNCIVVKVSQDLGGWDLFMELDPPIRVSQPALTPNDDGVNDTVQFQFSLSGPTTGTLEILGANRQPVRTLIKSDRIVPNTDYSWDGKDASGRLCPAGAYTVAASFAPGLKLEQPVELKTAPPLRRQAYAEFRQFFPIGMFYDSGQLPAKIAVFEAECRDLAAHGMNSIMFANFHVPLGSARNPQLEVMTRLNLKAIHSLGSGNGFFNNATPADEDEARTLLAPMVREMATYPCFLAYYLWDEPTGFLAHKLQVAARVIEDMDAQRPPYCCLIGARSIQKIQAQMQSSLLCIDPYAIGLNNPPGDFSMGHFGSKELDYSAYIDLSRKASPSGSVLWVIIQTHNFMTQLREPSPAEVSVMNWLALGHGAKGIFWFIYQTEQGWRGLRDPAETNRYRVVNEFAHALQPLLPILVQTEFNDKPPAECQTPKAEICGLRNPKSGVQYLVCANRDVTAAQTVAGKFISAPPAKLRDLVTGKSISIVAGGFAISLPPGGGTLLAME